MAPIKGLERVIVVGASADSSTLDVERGWLAALQAAGYSVYSYSLRNRLKMWTDLIGVMKNGVTCGHCGGEVRGAYPEHANSDQVTVMQAASECVIHEALRHRAKWAIIISGCSFHPNGAAFLQQVGIPVVTIMTESPYNDDNMIDLARVSTIVGVNERKSVAFFEKCAGETAMYLPTGYTKGIHGPGKNQPDSPARETDVFFCGTGFDERAELFANTKWEGVDFALAGFWPTSEKSEVIPDSVEGRLGQISIGHDPRLQPYLVAGILDNRETVEWYRRAKIVLSVHRKDSRAESIGPRVYEVAAIGAFQLCDDSRPEIDEIFRGSIPCFRSGDPEHLRWMVQYYLDRPNTRAALAEKSHKYVRGHSYDDRLASLAGTIQGLMGSA